MTSSMAMIFPKYERPVVLRNATMLSVEPETVVEIPLLGNIAAGFPIEVCPQQETVSVPYSMTRKECYALKVIGDSMVDDNIEDGDIVVVERCSTAANGQSVVVLIYGDSVTLKRFYIESDGIGSGVIRTPNRC